MSISWSRLIPQAVKGSPLNPKGVEFYNNVFDELHKNGIEPAVTLYHWDMPQVTQGLLEQQQNAQQETAVVTGSLSAVMHGSGNTTVNKTATVAVGVQMG